MQHRRGARSAGDETYAVVAPSGEIDISAAPVLREALLAAHARRPGLLLVDLSDVSFIDAAALGVVVGVARDLGPAAVALVVPHENVARIFQACGLDRVLGIYRSRAQALAARVPSVVAPADGVDEEGRPRAAVHPLAGHVPTA
jgi:anti-sigma B factor antagonist